ncbi:MAG: hypothetical protein ACQGTM_15615 [bacterium]
MDETVKTALKQLLSALEAAADAEGSSVAELNAYFVFEQIVSNAAGNCAQALHWAEKKEAKSHDEWRLNPQHE